MSLPTGSTEPSGLASTARHDPPAPDIVLQLRGVTKHYTMGVETIRALDGVDLIVHRGEYVAIMGPSGSGKSTMLNILGCMDLPTQGDYFLGGENVAELAQSSLARIRGRRIGFVFQTFELLARASAIKNVELPLVYAGVRQRRKRAIEPSTASASNLECTIDPTSFRAGNGSESPSPAL